MRKPIVAETYTLARVSQRHRESPPGAEDSVSPTPRSEDLPLGGAWVTPGLYLARKILTRPEILRVTEKIEPARHCVLVLVESDPEDLMDQIFEVEQKMYTTFKKLPFDVRVVLKQPDMDADLLRRESLVHYERT